MLPTRSWHPGNHATLQAWLSDKPSGTAVFDWDNTCIFNDIGDACFRLRLERMLFREETLAELLPLQVEGKRALRNVALSALRDDILSAFATRSKNDFCAKLAWLSEALRLEIGAHYEYPWVTRMHAGSSADELRAFAQDACRDEPIGSTLLQSDTPGKTGLLSCTLDTGIRAYAEMRDLMEQMKAAGLAVRVVSASLEPLVQGAAMTLGFPLETNEIFGMRLVEKDGVLTPERPQEADYPTPYRQGKVELIERVLRVKPAFVAGDANTDYEMLTQFAETQIRLVINRDRPAGEDIAKLYAPARATKLPAKVVPGQSITLLQGRDVRAGVFIPER